MSDITRHDDDLFSILKDCRTLPTFLDVVFGFLNRRTDFYETATTPNSPVGLPNGLAERLVKNTFFKWKPKDLEMEENVPEAVSEIVAESLECSEDIEIGTEVVCDEEEKHVEDVEKKEVTFTSSDSYNGAVYKDYSWSQTITEIDIIVKIPKDITTKNLIVSIMPQRLLVKLKTTNVMLLDGELCQKCKHNDAIWSLDKSKLEIHLEKCYEMWWDCLLKGEPLLDVSKIDCSRPFEELSEEAQAKIHELTWNQEQKRLGLPTSDELKMQDTLKRAWNVEGSPFKGPFDPTTVKLN